MSPLIGNFRGLWSVEPAEASSFPLSTLRPTPSTLAEKNIPSSSSSSSTVVTSSIGDDTMDPFLFMRPFSDHINRYTPTLPHPHFVSSLPYPPRPPSPYPHFASFPPIPSPQLIPPPLPHTPYPPLSPSPPLTQPTLPRIPPCQFVCSFHHLYASVLLPSSRTQSPPISTILFFRD